MKTDLSDELKFKSSVQPVQLGSELEFKDVEHGRPCRIARISTCCHLVPY